MPRPRRTLTYKESLDIMEAWSKSGTVEGCRKEYAKITEQDKPPAWDTMRRWLSQLGIREDPTKG